MAFVLLWFIAAGGDEPGQATFVDSAHLHIALMQKARNADPDPESRTWISDCDEIDDAFMELANYAKSVFFPRFPSFFFCIGNGW